MTQEQIKEAMKCPSTFDCESVRKQIAELGDCTNELDASHDPDDLPVWRAILEENLADELPPSA